MEEEEKKTFLEPEDDLGRDRKNYISPKGGRVEFEDEIPKEGDGIPQYAREPKKKNRW